MEEAIDRTPQQILEQVLDEIKAGNIKPTKCIIIFKGDTKTPEGQRTNYNAGLVYEEFLGLLEAVKHDTIFTALAEDDNEEPEWKKSL